VRSGGAVELFREFSRRTGLPVVHSLMGVDLLPFDDPWRCGMIGTYGNRWANWAVGRSDFLLVLGSRLDVRQTGSETVAFKTGRSIVHVDCEAGEVNNRVQGCLPVLASLRGFLTEAIRRFGNRPLPNHEGWRAEIAGRRAEWPDVAEAGRVPGLNPNEFMHLLSRASGQAGGFVVDVGQHQMWAAQSLELNARQRFLTSGGLGSMGFALPAAVGASLAIPGTPLVVIAGDGGFQCNLQELQTVVRNRLPLKIVVLNNHCHGMVRQFQESYFEGRYQSTLWGYDTPDFAKVAGAYGLAAQRVQEPAGVPQALAWLWSAPAEPKLLEVAVDPYTNVYPKMAFGRPMTEMEPLAQPMEMEGT
jgi:acetolactate synthase I/II/III large subunit